MGLLDNKVKKFSCFLPKIIISPIYEMLINELWQCDYLPESLEVMLAVPMLSLPCKSNITSATSFKISQIDGILVIIMIIIIHLIIMMIIIEMIIIMMIRIENEPRPD